MLAGIEVEDLWGISSKRGRLLRQYGIATAYDLKYASDGWVKKNLTIMGLRTQWELRGISCIPLELAPPPKKGMCSSRSFGRPIESLEELKEAVATYTSRIAEKLRVQKSTACNIQVFIHTSRFKASEPQYANHINLTLPQPSSFTPTLVRYALHGLEKIYRPGYKYVKAGVLVTTIGRQDELQLNLWEEGPDPWDLEEELALSGVVDSINQKWGRDTLRLAASGLERNWGMQQGRVSPHYTTRWSDLPVVRAA
jgi:DNA polymerase V